MPAVTVMDSVLTNYKKLKIVNECYKKISLAKEENGYAI